MIPWQWSNESGRLLTMPVVPVSAEARTRLYKWKGSWIVRLYRGRSVITMVRHPLGWLDGPP